MENQTQKLDYKTTKCLIENRSILIKQIREEMETGNYNVYDVLRLIKLDSYYAGLINQYLESIKI